MGKKRGRTEGSSDHGSPKKKHKKTKQHKKHRRHSGENPAVESSEGTPVGTVRPITLKIKLGDQLISSSTSEVLLIPPTADDTSSIAESEPQSLIGAESVGVAEEDWVEGSDDVSVGKEESLVDSNLASEDEQEEEAWLEALEAGEVDERGYLPQKKNTSSLTARQRAMMGEEEGNDLVELPLNKSRSEMTEEMLLKKSEKNQKRRLAAQKRKEKRKAETVRRLLEKQSTKKKEEENPKLPSKPVVPHIRYINSTRLDGVGTTLSLPDGMDYPLQPQNNTSSPPPMPQRCSITGCNNTKKYSDSVSKKPLCSLACYGKLRTELSNSQNTLLTSSTIVPATAAVSL